MADEDERLVDMTRCPLCTYSSSTSYGQNRQLRERIQRKCWLVQFVRLSFHFQQKDLERCIGLQIQSYRDLQKSTKFLTFNLVNFLRMHAKKRLARIQQMRFH